MAVATGALASPEPPQIQMAAAAPIVASTSQAHPQLQRVASAQYNKPFLDFLQDDTREGIARFLELCVPLHKHALKGNWAAAKRILDQQDNRLRYAAIANGWPTVLHVAAGANHFHFVEGLLRLMDLDDSDYNLALQDIKGNTAFCFAAAVGNMQIVQLMLQRNPHLPKIKGGDGMTPIHFAALQGRCEMAMFLYDHTIEAFDNRDWKLLFFTCINTGIYDLAIKMVNNRPELASARDHNEYTGLHLLAQKTLDSGRVSPEHQIVPKPGMKQNMVFRKLVSCLWKMILSRADSKSEINKIIGEPYQLLFDAAEAGNFEFLSELISAYPNLIWEVDNRDRSIIHTAVLHRHAGIYNLIHEIGYKDIFVTYIDEVDNSTLLHLAAKLAPTAQLDLVSGAAFQMSLELLWFEEVKKVMPPSLIKVRNSDGLTARELFTIEHAELRKKAEAWMKRTAEFCMLVSTVIAASVFSAAISLQGGTGTPNYKKTSFLIFAISDAIALISSSTSILIFLSILISRYAEYDFYKSLPLKLIFGLVTLFISITSMMVAFGCSFFITYDNGLKWVPVCISILASLPILLFIILKFSLWSDIMYSTYYCRSLFKPGKYMLVVNDHTLTT